MKSGVGVVNHSTPCTKELHQYFETRLSLARSESYSLSAYSLACRDTYLVSGGDFLHATSTGMFGTLLAWHLGTYRTLEKLTTDVRIKYSFIWNPY